MKVRTAVSVQKDSSVAADIIEKVRRDGYDTLVLGRWKGSGSATGRSLGSVTVEVIHGLPDCPIWVLD